MTERSNETQSILERLQSIDPKRDVAFIAIEELIDPEEMRQFMAEYVEYLATSNDEEIRKDPARVAGSNIGYIIGYFSKETSDRWLNTIEGLSHPVFGRNIPYSDPARAKQVGEMAGRLDQSKN